MEKPSFMKFRHRIIKITEEQVTETFEKMEDLGYELICATQNGIVYTLFFRTNAETQEAILKDRVHSVPGGREGW